MKIGQLAERSGTSTSRIRFYEKHGLIPPAARRNNGYRDYPEETEQRLKTIVLCQSLGFSLAEIRRNLPSDPKAMMDCEEATAELQVKLADVRMHIKELHALESRILDMLRYFERNKRDGQHGTPDMFLQQQAQAPYR